MSKSPDATPGRPVPPLPGLHRFDAPPQWRAIDFLSDLHLSPAQPRTLAAFANAVETSDADAILILGDLFEAWVGDDARSQVFEDEVVALLRATASERWLGFMCGNRDFLLGAEMRDACGLHELPDPSVVNAWGRPVLLSHGDALCLDDVDYQRFRAEVRSPAWQSDFLARPLGQRQALARGMRDASQQHQREAPQFGDLDAVAMKAWLSASGCRDLVHGHTHRPGSQRLAAGRWRHVLTDWDFDGDSPRGQTLRLTRNGFSRRPAFPA